MTAASRIVVNLGWSFVLHYFSLDGGDEIVKIKRRVVTFAIDKESGCPIHAALQAPHEIAADLGSEGATLQQFAQKPLGEAQSVSKRRGKEARSPSLGSHRDRHASPKTAHERPRTQLVSAALSALGWICVSGKLRNTKQSRLPKCFCTALTTG